MDFIIEWNGAPSEQLALLLEKSQQNSGTPTGTLNAHLITTRKTISFTELFAIWMGYPGVPESIKNNPAFNLLLGVVTIALISPRALRLVPDDAASVLGAFEIKDFYRTITLNSIIATVGDEETAKEGIRFLLDRKLIESLGDDEYRLLEVPLNNVKLEFRLLREK
jgi:hypothetical protein